MKKLPHTYEVSASGAPDGSVTVESEGSPTLATHPPPEFGGPGGHWSPESLLVAAVADCFVLSFRAIARASHLGWQSLSCHAKGVLDKGDEGKVRFLRFEIRPTLTVEAGTDEDKARRLLEKAEANCLVTNSMTAKIELETDVRTA